jgi:hypothetical protein
MAHYVFHMAVCECVSIKPGSIKREATGARDGFLAAALSPFFLEAIRKFDMIEFPSVLCWSFQKTIMQVKSGSCQLS